MAEESESLKSVGGLIPSVYYDLIARVFAGVPLIALMAWVPAEPHFWRLELGLGELVEIILILGAGYIVGLLLTPLSVVTGALIPGFIRCWLDIRRQGSTERKIKDKANWLDGVFAPMEEMRLLDDHFHLSGARWFRNDIIASVDKDAGVLIAKMQAEMILCMNLLAGYLLLTLAHWQWTDLAPIVSNSPFWWIAGVLLGLTCIHRQFMYLGRQCVLYNLYAGRLFHRQGPAAPPLPK
jgi:hypothetical protein